MCSLINAFIAHNDFFLPYIHMPLGWSFILISVSQVSQVDVSVFISVTDQSDDSDQTKVVVGVVVGLLVATVVIGLAYWVYMKKSK